MSFATRLKEARSKAGLSQKDLALKLGTSPQNLAQYENGKRNPKKETLVKIANALDMGVTYSQNGEAYFFCFVDPEEPRNSENNLFNDSQLKDASDVSPSSQYNEPITIAAHFEGDNFTPEELKQIEQFAEFIKSKRTPKEETFLNAAHDMGATPEQRRNADDLCRMIPNGMTYRHQSGQLLPPSGTKRSFWRHMPASMWSQRRRGCSMILIL